MPSNNPAGRPAIYTPAEAKARRKAQAAARLARARAAGPKDCEVSRCHAQADPPSDLCKAHTRRRSHFGHPLAGPLAPTDYQRSVRRVLAVIPRLDPELVQLALKACEEIVVTPGQQSIPRQRSKHDTRYHLAVELHRLQHPPMPGRFPKNRKGQDIRTKASPVTAREVFVAATSSWLCAVIPGCITQPARRHPAPPRFEDQRAIESLIGGAVLRRRLYHYPEVYDHTLGRTRRLRWSASPSATAKRELGRQIMAALSPMLPLLRREIQLTMTRGAKRAAGIARNRRVSTVETSPAPDPTPFVFPEGEIS